ncbi:hypothetical protein [Staphylococcus phage vB_StaM_PB50]|nr:hypothetical protein [Staphylococcus phage vB_StaM_PB50]
MKVLVKKVNILSDVIDLLKDSTTGNVKNNYKNNSRRKRPFDRTLRGKAGDFILQFPLVTSDALDNDTVELMRNQLELERAYEFEYILTNTPIQEYNPKDPNSFMGDLHQNINFNESTKQDIKRVNDYLTESPDEKFNKTSINDMSITKEEMDLLNEETIDFEDSREIKGYIEFDVKEFLKANNPDTKDTYTATVYIIKPNSNGEQLEFLFNNLKEVKYRGGEDNSRSLYDILKTSSNEGTLSDNGMKFLYGSMEIAEAFSSYIKNIIGVKPDIQTNQYDNYGTTTTIQKDKLNSSIPTMVNTNVTFLITDSKGEPVSGINHPSKPVKFGVKTVVHPVKTEDVVFYLSDKSRKSNLVTKLVKFTTGELRLFRDLLLDTERTKKIARDSKKGRTGAIWNKLNSIYTVDRAGSITRSKSGNYIPTTALMISIDETQEVKRKTGVDLLNDRRAVDKVYKEFFLLEFIVIDEARELVYKYLPEHRKFEIIKQNKLGALKVSSDSKKGDIDSKDLAKLLKR